MSSVVEQIPYNEYTANGVTTVFPYEFQLFSTADLVVYFNGVEQATSLYSISGLGEQDGGDVTFTVAPANGVKVLLSREIKLEREVDYQYNGPLKESTVDLDFNRLWQALQGQAVQLGGAIKLPYPEQAGSMPAVSGRLDRLIYFHEVSGLPILTPFTQTQVASAVAAAYGTGSTLDALTFVQAGTGAVPRTAQDKMRDIVNAADYLTLADALAAASEVQITSAITVSASLNVASTKTLRVMEGGSISVASGQTLTIRGHFHAPIRSVFTGAGSVVGLREVWPEWFGAVGGGTADDLSPLQKSHICVQSSKDSIGGEFAINLTNVYGVSATWVVEPTTDIPLRVRGRGVLPGQARLKDIAAFASTTTPVLQVKGSTTGAQQITDWGLKDISIEHGAGSATIGLQIGDTSSSSKLEGVTWANVENVNVDQFANNWKIVHARMVRFSRCSGWNNGYVGACTPLLITTNGGFTGDLEFDDTCQFVSNDATTANTRCIRIECTSGDYNAGTGANQVAGIRFGNIDLYKGQRAVTIYCSNGSYISDIWFAGTQWDQQSTIALHIEADKTTATTPVIQNVNVLGAYFSSNLDQAIWLVSTSGGIIRETNVDGCYSSGGQKEFLKVSGTANAVKSLGVNNNRILNNNHQAGNVIDLGTVESATCKGNRLSRSDGSSFMAYMIGISVGANRYVVRDNDAGGLPSTGLVNDGGGAVTKSVGDNI